jgi:uncharacterized Zn-finger protein
MRRKAHKCDVAGCNAAFNRLFHLTIHKRTHTGEKPYKCDFAGCNRAFSQSVHLNLHKRVCPFDVRADM